MLEAAETQPLKLRAWIRAIANANAACQRSLPRLPSYITVAVGRTLACVIFFFSHVTFDLDGPFRGYARGTILGQTGSSRQRTTAALY